MTKKRALITGITGQDGAYLAELLLAKATRSTASSAGPRSSIRTASTISTTTRTSRHRRFRLHYGDLTDSTSLIRIVQQVQPDEIYNLAAQSHVAVSFEEPGVHGQFRRAWDRCGCSRPSASWAWRSKTRFYQASTSELFGLVQETPQKETTPFYPRSPYAVAKLYALLDHGELPRGLRHVRLQRHPLQSRSRRSAARPSSPARSPAPWPASSSGCRTASISATSMRCATGAMPGTTSRCSG